MTRMVGQRWTISTGIGTDRRVRTRCPRRRHAHSRGNATTDSASATRSVGISPPVEPAVSRESAAGWRRAVGATRRSSRNGPVMALMGWTVGHPHSGPRSGPSPCPGRSRRPIAPLCEYPSRFLLPSRFLYAANVRRPCRAARCFPSHSSSSAGRRSRPARSPTATTAAGLPPAGRPPPVAERNSPRWRPPLEDEQRADRDAPLEPRLTAWPGTRGQPTLPILIDVNTLALPRDMNALIDAADYPALVARPWLAHDTGHAVYAATSHAKRRMHRLLLDAPAGIAAG